MSKLAPALLLFLTALSVHGGERLADIRPGIPCNAIPALERQLGSIELTEQESAGISEYRGTHGGREARIVYQCSEGSLTEQTVIVTALTRAEAYRLADEQTVELSKRLGRPIHDGLNLPGWRKLLFGFLGGDLDYLTAVVVWGRADEDVMLSLKEIGGKLWQISISQGSSKLEYITNS